MAVVLLIMTVIMAAMAPVMTTRLSGNKVAQGGGAGGASIWKYVEDSGDTDIYYGTASNQRAMIGQNKADTAENARLILNTSDDIPNHLMFRKGSDTLGALSMQTQVASDNNNYLAIQLGNLASGTSSGIGAISIGNNIANTKGLGIAIGNNSSSTGTGGIAIGNNSSSTGTCGIAIGADAQASGLLSIAIGDAKATGMNSIALLGTASDASLAFLGSANERGAIALGFGCRANGQNSTCIGVRNFVSGTSSTALGTGSNAEADYSIALGNMGDTMSDATTASAKFSVAIGPRAVASAESTIALGHQAKSQNINSIVIGTLAEAIADNSVAIGYNAKAETANTIVLGTASETVQIPGSLTVATTNYPSDKNLKNVGKEYTSGLDKIKQLKPFNFTYKDDKTKTPRVGVIAQDLKKAFPDAVSKGKDGFLTIRLEDMFYALINAVKELDQKVTQLIKQESDKDKKIKELEKRIELLEQKLK